MNNNLIDKDSALIESTMNYETARGYLDSALQLLILADKEFQNASLTGSAGIPDPEKQSPSDIMWIERYRAKKALKLIKSNYANLKKYLPEEK